MSAAAATGTAPAEAPSRVSVLREAVAALLGAERRLRGRDHTRQGELTIAQIRSLAALRRDPEMTAGALAKSASLNPATVTAMLDHLEAAGIVARHRSTTDRRVCNVSLTPEGQRIVDDKIAAWQNLWEQELSGFTDEELETATRVVQRVSDLFDALPPAR